jgi:hypothetical protein
MPKSSLGQMGRHWLDNLAYIHARHRGTRCKRRRRVRTTPMTPFGVTRSRDWELGTPQNWRVGPAHGISPPARPTTSRDNIDKLRLACRYRFQMGPQRLGSNSGTENLPLHTLHTVHSTRRVARRMVERPHRKQEAKPGHWRGIQSGCRCCSHLDPRRLESNAGSDDWCH